MPKKPKSRVERITIKTTKGSASINLKKGEATFTGSFADAFVKQAMADRKEKKS